MKKKRAAPARTFTTRIPGVNISISLQPTRKGITVVKPRVSRVTISRGRNPGVPMTDAIARAAAMDAANAQMRAAGRKKWNRSDMNLAVRTFNRLSPHETLKSNPFSMGTSPGYTGVSRPGSVIPTYRFSS